MRSFSFLSGRFLLVLILFFALRLPGFTWGLPGPERNWPYWPDEIFPMRGLAAMSFSERDFDPRQSKGGHAYIYTTGVALLAAQATGYLELPASAEDLKSDPLTLERCYFSLRLLALGFDILALIAAMLLGARWAGRAGGHWAGIFYATMPFSVLMAHSGNYFTPVMAFVLLAMLAAEKSIDTKNWRYSVAAGGLIGYATGFMWLGGLLGIAGIFFFPKFRSAVIFYTSLLAVFALTSPYVMIHYERTLGGFLELAGNYLISSDDAASSLRDPLRSITVIAVSAGLLLFCAAIAGVFFRFREATVRIGLYAFLFTTSALIYLNAPLSRHYAPLLAFLPAFAAVAVVKFSRRVSFAVGTILAVVLCFQSIAMIWPMIGDDPREASHEWIEKNISEGSLFVGMNWYSVPHISTARYPTTMLWTNFSDSFASTPHDYLLASNHDGVFSLVDNAASHKMIAEFSIRYPAWLSWALPRSVPADIEHFRPVIRVYRRTGVIERSTSEPPA